MVVVDLAMSIYMIHKGKPKHLIFYPLEKNCARKGVEIRLCTAAYVPALHVYETS